MSATWTEEATKTFVLVLVEYAASNKGTENGFKKQAWNEVHDQFSRRSKVKMTSFKSKV
jgi:hypothetical protein